MHLVTYLHPRLPTDSAEEPLYQSRCARSLNSESLSGLIHNLLKFSIFPQLLLLNCGPVWPCCRMAGGGTFCMKIWKI